MFSEICIKNIFSPLSIFDFSDNFPKIFLSVPKDFRNRFLQIFTKHCFRCVFVLSLSIFQSRRSLYGNIRRSKSIRRPVLHQSDFNTACLPPPPPTHRMKYNNSKYGPSNPVMDYFIMQHHLFRKGFLK